MKGKAKEFLSKMFYQNRVPFSLIFFGREGIGKKELAFEFATALLCLEKTYPPCGRCESCRHMESFKKRKPEELYFYGEDRLGKSVFLYLRGDHPDFIYLTPEKTEIKIDQIRGVKDFVFLSPALSERKVVFVEPAERMNPYAQNALLKVLEEPPPNTHFLIVTSNLQKILPTVRSRSFLLEVPPLSEEELKELTGIQDPLILELSEGSLHMAKKLKEDKELLGALKVITEGDVLSIYRKALEMEKWEQERQIELFRLLQSFFHRRYIQSRKEKDRELLDRVSAGIDYLSKGVKPSLILFLLRGGDKHVLHKGKVSGQQQNLSG